jgi:hypothetical protein
MNENIAIVALISSTICFVMAYVVTLKKLIISQKLAGRLYVDNFTLEEYIKTVKNLKEDKTDQQIHQENFLKFISDSRDWAFEYIEKVQDGLSEFIDSVDSDIKYFDKYGEVLSVNRPDYDAMKRISIAYKNLSSLLPEEKTNEE